MNARDILDYIWIVPVLPLFGAALLLLVGRRIGEPVAGWIASGLMILAFALSCVMLFALLDLPAEARLQTHTLFSWVPAGTLRVDMGTQADPLSITWILLVTGVGSLIHIYSVGYMHGEAQFSRFFASLNLFAASMLILVLADNFLLTFLGWEGVGLCSYLLISFWYERNSAAVAGKKAFVTNRVGDVGFLLAMFLIIATYGTLSYSAMGPAAQGISSSTSTAIALLLLVGAMGKSAQIGLHIWLTDAMEGPTPVSALIHAATMVTAGVFLLVRAHAFFDVSGDAQTVVMWVGAATALLAGTIALVQPDVKRVLAYSTISQLGYMFLAIGVGAYSAAVFMVLCHAFYKGTLFLGAGSVIHGNRENQDMRIMGGLRKLLPYTAGACVVAWLAIAGIPPFSGFWSKDEILVSAFASENYGVWIVGTIAAIFTGLYMTRLIFMTFYGNERWHDAGALPVVAGGSDDGGVAVLEAAVDHDVADTEFDPDFEPTVQFGEPPRSPRLHRRVPHESPTVMVAPLLALAFFAAVGGLLNLPIGSLDFLTRFLEPVFHGVHEPHPSTVEQISVEGVSVIFAATGVAIGYFLYRRGLRTPAEDPLPEKLGGAAKVLGNAYYYDAAISWFVGGPGQRAASWLDRFFDQKIIDGAVNGVAKLFGWFGKQLSKVEDGLVRRYALGILLGTVAALLYLILWAGR